MRGSAVRPGDLAKYPAARAALRGKHPRAKRAVRDSRHGMALAPRQDGVLDTALLQVVEDLIARDPVRARYRQRLLEISNVEVTHAPRDNLTLLHEFLERSYRFCKGIRPRPVQQVTVESVGAQPLQALVARPERSLVRRMLRKHLRDEKHLIAPADDCLAHQLLHGARPLPLGRAPLGHREIESLVDPRASPRAIRQL